MTDMDRNRNYLDIYPSNSIARKIEEEPLDHRWYDQLVTNATMYLKIMEHENVDFLEKRQGPTLDSGDTYKFLRSQERTRHSKLMIQYLITFLSKGLPMAEDIKDDPANPFEQFKSFLLFHIDLLKEKDVSEAILKEHEYLGLLNDTNAWYYRGQIDKNHRLMRQSVEMSNAISIEGYCKLFHTVQKLCVFWFSVRNEKVERVRKSDIMAYKLCRFLLNKYEPNDS